MVLGLLIGGDGIELGRGQLCVAGKLLQPVLEALALRLRVDLQHDVKQLRNGVVLSGVDTERGVVVLVSRWDYARPFNDKLSEFGCSIFDAFEGRLRGVNDFGHDRGRIVWERTA